MKNTDIQIGEEYVAVITGSVPQFGRTPIHVGHVRALRKGVEIKVGPGWRAKTLKTGVEVEFIEKYGNAWKVGDKLTLEPRRFYMKLDDYTDMKVRQAAAFAEREKAAEARKKRVGDLNQKFAEAGFSLHMGTAYGRPALVGDLDEIERLVDQIRKLEDAYRKARGVAL